VIAQGLSQYAPESVAFEAGRLMLRRWDELAADQTSFAFESTLSSRTFAPWLRKRKAEGYTVTIFFICLPSAEAHILRVAHRVRAGGHHVDDDTVRRRYGRSIANFRQLDLPIADHWMVIHNDAGDRPLALASGYGPDIPWKLKNVSRTPSIWNGSCKSA
jgi:predicted ABC-type ATPase